MKVERAFKNIDNLLSQRFQAQREAGGPTSVPITWANWECGMLEMPMKMKGKEEVGGYIYTSVFQVWDLGFREDQ